MSEPFCFSHLHKQLIASPSEKWLLSLSSFSSLSEGLFFFFSLSTISLFWTSGERVKNRGENYVFTKQTQRDGLDETVDSPIDLFKILFFIFVFNFYVNFELKVWFSYFWFGLKQDDEWLQGGDDQWWHARVLCAFPWTQWQ